VKTYKHNFGSDYIICGDIRKIKTETIPDFDILTAGFPCQPFSVRGKQLGFKDPRGNLFFEITRIIDKKRPQVVFLENVANLTEHDEGRTFLVLYNSLAQFGYCVKYKILDANAYGGIPQKRERIFIVAFLDYEVCNRFKFPKEIPTEKTLNFYLQRDKFQDSKYYYTESSLLYDELQRVVTDMDALYLITDYGVSRKKHYIVSTLKANMGTFPDRVPVLRDEYGIRKITESECLALQGFPKEYSFVSDINFNAKYKQVGNTVCVPVVRRIAEKIAEVLR
jgi:DNA (cytosine-5)-methyltransferase 1